jgi:hypothetical protein
MASFFSVLVFLLLSLLPFSLFVRSASSGRNLETCDHGGAAAHGVVEQRFHRPPQVLPSWLDITINSSAAC